MRRHIGPLHSGYRPPPLAPSRGPLAPARRCSGASACRFASQLRRGPRPPAPLASGYRRLCPPVAPPPSRPPTRLATPYGRLGRLRHSVLRSPSGCSGWSHGPPSAPQRAPSRPFCAEASVGPPRTAPPAPCPPSSLGRLVAWAGYGLRSSRLGPGAALRAASLRHRPQAFFENTVRGQNWFVKLAVFRSFQRRTAARNGNTVQGRIRRESDDHSGSSPNTLREKKRKEYTSEVENSEKVPDFTCVHCITFFSGSALITTIML